MAGFILWLGLSLGMQEGFTVLQNPTFYEIKNNQTVLYSSEVGMELFPYYLVADIHLDNKYFGIYGIYKIDMDKSTTKIFDPYLHGYTVGVEFTLGKSSLKIEYHRTNSINDALQYDSWYNKIELRVVSK